jgi:4-amino-4-deoxy-L-arabinose transferase-like glycosyltransferase
MRRGNGLLILLAIIAVGVILRLSLILLLPTTPISDFSVFDEIAARVASGAGYTDSGGLPTTYRPPGYPLFLATIYTLFGRSWFAARLANVVLAVICIILTCLLAKGLFSQRVGLLSALIVALYPSHILYGNLLASENLFIPLLLATCLAFFYGMNRENKRLAFLVVAGMLLGLAVLTRPAAILLPVVFGTVLLARRAVPKEIGVSIGLVIVSMIVVVIPWTARNYISTGELVPVASEGGITFLAGHNSHSIQGTYALTGPEVEELYAEDLSEAQFDAYAYKLAFQFIRENPRTELVLLVRKFIFFFRDDVSGVSWNQQSSIKPFSTNLAVAIKATAQAYYMTIALMALFALIRRRLPSDRWYLLGIGIVIYWTLIHLAYYGKDRFRLPLFPFFAMFAAVTLSSLVDHFLRSRRDRI